jgi:ubiquitin carboxyl-terminal hydrolase 7
MMRETTVKVSDWNIGSGNLKSYLIWWLTYRFQINDRHEFPLEIDLEPYLSPAADKSKPHKYILQGYVEISINVWRLLVMTKNARTDLSRVLVHSGDLSGGHYFAFVKPTKNASW